MLTDYQLRCSLSVDGDVDRDVPQDLDSALIDLLLYCQQMIPDVTLEQPGIDRVGYELAARLVYTLDELERTRNSG